MKRSLVMLLVVALLAMMIPGFALAEEAAAEVTPKIQFTAEGKKADTDDVMLQSAGKYYGDIAIEAKPVTLEVSGLEGTPYVEITSSNEDVVSVIYSGGQYRNNYGPLDELVTFKGEGTAVLTAVLYDVADKKLGEDTITVNVTKLPIKSLTVKNETIKLFVNPYGYGEYAQVAVDPENAYNANRLLYSVADPTIATIDNEGLIKPVKAGTTTVTVKDPDGKAKEATITVIVKEHSTDWEEPKPTITVSTAVHTMKVNDSPLDLSDFLTVEPSYVDLLWTSSDEKVATVTSATGLVIPIKPGTVTITVTSPYYPEVEQKFTVTVEPVDPVKSVKFVNIPKELTAPVYWFNFTNYATVDPLDYQVYDTDMIEWKVSDPQIASVRAQDWYYDYEEEEWVGGYVALTTFKVDKPTDLTVSAYAVADGTKLGEFTVTLKPVYVEKIEFAKEAFSVDAGLDQSEDLSEYCKLLPEEATTPASIVWESSDVDIASVDDEGIVTGYKAGTVNITVTITNGDGSVIAKTVKVTVNPVEVKSVSFAKSYQDIVIPLYDIDSGSRFESVNTATVIATVNPENASYTTKWETSDAYVAFVSSSVANVATILAKNPGTCVITLTVDDGVRTTSASINVTVKAANVVDLKLSKKKATVYMFKGADNTLQLTAIDKKSGEEVPVKWTSSDKKVATVNKYGLVKFLKAGKVKITATTKDGNATTATCKLKIKKLKVKSITPARKALKMKVGQEKVLKVKVLPEKAFNPRLNMLSSNPNVVTVDNDGNLVALKEGTAEITITTKDGTKMQTTVTITVAGYTAENEVEEIEDSVIDITVEGEVIDDLGDFEDLFIEEDGEVTLD